MPGVRILIPNIETDLAEGEVGLLANELVLLGDSGRAVAADMQRGPEYAIDDENRGTVARALDHLRNHGDLDTSDSLVRLRDALVADWPPTTYELVASGHEPRRFDSYSGAYIVGDRLVDGGGDAWRVTHRQDHDPPRLIVDVWSTE